jgi:hypothetical protein
LKALVRDNGKKEYCQNAVDDIDHNPRKPWQPLHKKINGNMPLFNGGIGKRERNRQGAQKTDGFVSPGIETRKKRSSTSPVVTSIIKKIAAEAIQLILAAAFEIY